MQILQLIQEGGIAAWLIVITPGLTMPLLIVLAGLSAVRFRVPAALWFLPPVAALLLGHAGVIFGTIQVRNALAWADPAAKATIAAAGLSESFSSRLLAQGTATTLFLAAATLAALSNLRAGEKPVWTWAHAIAPAGLGLLAAAASVPAVLAGDALGVALGAVGLLAAVLLAVVSLRLDEEAPHAARTAAARGLVGTALFAAAVTVFATQLTWGRIEVFSAVAMADPSEKVSLLARGMRIYPWGLVPGIALVGLAGLAATAPAARALDRRALIGGIVGVAALVVAPLVRIGVDVWAATTMSAFMGAWTP